LSEWLNMLEEDRKEPVKEESKKTNTKSPEKKIIPTIENGSINISKTDQESEKDLSSIENALNSIDVSRGLFKMVTLIVDRKSTKEQMNLKIKKQLLTPEGFGTFLENLSIYLKSI
jgi:hypothetical protein